MQTQSCFRTYASGVILIGCMLAFISAVAPHYTAGYHLMLSVLLSGLLPYLIQVSRYLDKDFMTSLSKIDSPTRRLIPFAPTGLRPPRLRITWLINSLATLRHGYHNASTATIAAAASSTHFAIAHTPNMQTALPIGD